MLVAPDRQFVLHGNAFHTRQAVHLQGLCHREQSVEGHAQIIKQKKKNASE